MPPNPELPQTPPPTEQVNRQNQPNSPEQKNRQPVTLQQRTNQTVSRMVTGIDDVMLALRNLNVRVNTNGTPENQFREMFRSFMARNNSTNQPATTPTAPVQPTNGVTPAPEPTTTERARVARVNTPAPEGMPSQPS